MRNLASTPELPTALAIAPEPSPATGPAGGARDAPWGRGGLGAPRLVWIGAVVGASVYLAAVIGLAPLGVSFDGMAFLMGARAGLVDYGHALYQPLLGVAGALGDGLLSAERSAKLVSALGAVLAAALLWRHLGRRGCPPLLAGTVSGCFAFSGLFLHEAGSIEPTTWTVAALLLSAVAAEAYARRPGWVLLGSAVFGFGLAVGFHLVSICAFPWLLWLGIRGVRPLPRAHALVPLLALGAILTAAWIGGNLGAYMAYWSGFLPSLEGGVWSPFLRSIGRGGRLVLEGAPVLLAAGVFASWILARARRSALSEGAALGVPYLVAFLVFGKPLVGLLVPVILAAALLTGAAGHEALRAGRVRTLRVGLGLAIGLQGFLSLSQALEWRGAADVERDRAALLAAHLPADCLLFAGALSNHLRYYQPQVEVVSLPELWHRAQASSRSVDPIEVVQGALASAGRRCALSSDGAAFLYGLEADPARLGLTVESALWIPEDPGLALFPLTP